MDKVISNVLIKVLYNQLAILAFIIIGGDNDYVLNMLKKAYNNTWAEINTWAKTEDFEKNF